MGCTKREGTFRVKHCYHWKYTSQMFFIFLPLSEVQDSRWLCYRIRFKRMFGKENHLLWIPLLFHFLHSTPLSGFWCDDARFYFLEELE